MMEKIRNSGPYVVASPLPIATPPLVSKNRVYPILSNLNDLYQNIELPNLILFQVAIQFQFYLSFSLFLLLSL